LRRRRTTVTGILDVWYGSGTVGDGKMRLRQTSLIATTNCVLVSNAIRRTA
jgi:hypothetical protein